MRLLKGFSAIVLGLGLAACGDGANLPDSSRENGLTSDEQSNEDGSQDDEDNDESDRGDPEDDSGQGEEAATECYDVEDGLRECIVEDGDTVCVFIYETESGVMLDGYCDPVASQEEEDDCPCDDDDDSANEPSDGEDRPCPDEDGQHPDEDAGDDNWDNGWDDENSGQPDDPSSGEHACTENQDGSGSCTFEDGQGGTCVISWDANGEATEDTCSMHPEQP